LSEYLKKDTPLKVLDLGYNRVEDEGACMLSEALMYSNTNLEKLSLKNNNIGDEGLCALAECLLASSTLNFVYVWGNKFDKASCLVSFILLAKKKQS
jgi:Ran GTPase-activating protein (RanGAP) involved in mRNA processing and transport